VGSEEIDKWAVSSDISLHPSTKDTASPQHFISMGFPPTRLAFCPWLSISISVDQALAPCADARYRIETRRWTEAEVDPVDEVIRFTVSSTFTDRVELSALPLDPPHPP